MYNAKHMWCTIPHNTQSTHKIEEKGSQFFNPTYVLIIIQCLVDVRLAKVTCLKPEHYLNSLTKQLFYVAQICNNFFVIF